VKKIAKLLWNEPVIILGIVAGITSILAREHVVPPYVPLITLAITTSIQRAVVSPVGRVRKMLPVLKRELNL
jgi:hypothetical protein